MGIKTIEASYFYNSDVGSKVLITVSRQRTGVGSTIQRPIIWSREFIR
jgi:hypothetical protein